MPELNPKQFDTTNGRGTGRETYYHVEHEGLQNMEPGRQRGLTNYNYGTSVNGAMNTLRNEIAARENGQGKMVPDGRHKYTVYKHTEKGPEAHLIGFHEVKDGKTVAGTGTGFAPDLHSPASWFTSVG